MANRGKTIRVTAFFFLVLAIPVILSGCNGGSIDLGILETFDETTPYTGAIDIKMPQAPGEVVYGKNGVQIDASNKDEGYMVASASGFTRPAKVLITTPEGKDYTYNINTEGEQEVFPFSEGNGTYTIRVAEQVEGNQYAIIYSVDIDVEMNPDRVVFTYPNQRVSYTPDYKAVYLSYQLTQNCETLQEKIDKLCKFTALKITYDDEMAEKVRLGVIDSSYLPDPDRTLARRTGICYDYSALLAAMLRAQGVPTKLAMGWVVAEGEDPLYHAWNYYWNGSEWIWFDSTLYGSNISESDYTVDYQY